MSLTLWKYPYFLVAGLVTWKHYTASKYSKRVCVYVCVCIVFKELTIVWGSLQYYGHILCLPHFPFPPCFLAGLWLYLAGSSLPCLTLIGSPNFGYRSVHRDLEAQVAIVTKNKSLQQQFHQVCGSLIKLLWVLYYMMVLRTLVLGWVAGMGGWDSKLTKGSLA